MKRPWGQLPVSLELSYVSAVAADSTGNVYLCQRSDPPVIVFGPSGDYAASWGSGLIGDAHGMFVDSNDRVWIVDRDAHQIVQFDSRGEVITRLGRRNSPRFGQPFNHPAAVALGPDGDIYIADGYGNSMVHRFSPSGQWKTSWGGPGAGPGQFSTPHSIKVCADGRVVVCDRENNRLQFFDGSGSYLGERSDLYHPMDIYVDAEDHLYVTDQVPRLSLLDASGELIGRCRPVLYGAHGVWVAPAGDIYLAEASPMDRLTLLAKLSGSDLHGAD